MKYNVSGGLPLSPAWFFQGYRLRLRLFRDLVSSENPVAEDVDGFPLDAISIVGHADTAAVLGVTLNRVNVKLEKGDVLYVAQLQGGRLPEGAKTLPEGFRFEFLRVTI
jgi:hypothetical protein